VGYNRVQNSKYNTQRTNFAGLQKVNKNKHIVDNTFSKIEEL